jgi:hypothetical protein
MSPHLGIMTRERTSGTPPLGPLERGTGRGGREGRRLQSPAIIRNGLPAADSHKGASLVLRVQAVQNGILCGLENEGTREGGA